MKKGERKGRLASRVAVTGGVFIAATVFLLYSPWPPLFDVREIRVLGNTHVPNQEAVRLSGINVGDHLIRLSASRAVRGLSSIPWVKHAFVRRAFFHRVEITLIEREALATLSDPKRVKGEWVIGEDGVFLQSATAKVRPSLVLRGAVPKGQPAAGARLADTRVTALLARLFRYGLTDRALTIADVSDPASVVLQGPDDLSVLMGPLEGIEARVDELGALCLAMGKGFDVSQYRSIDLRFGGEATLVPRKVVKR